MRSLLPTVALIAVLATMSCSSPEAKEVCRASLCTDPVYLCDGARNQIELVINGRSTSSTILKVDVVTEVDGGKPATTPLIVEPATPQKKVVELARIRGVSGHTTTARINVRNDVGTALEVRSATFEPGEPCPQDV